MLISLKRAFNCYCLYLFIYLYLLQYILLLTLHDILKIKTQLCISLSRASLGRYYYVLSISSPGTVRISDVYNNYIHVTNTHSSLGDYGFV